ncbi:MAG: DUF397 domain-containing protein [Streptosporangiaceae bacterium]
MEPLSAPWRKSSRCNHGECIEVASLGIRRVAVRDSTDNAGGPQLAFAPAEWQSFVEDLKLGRARGR